MPEFEKTQSQPDPKHSYSPSTNASKKPGGRRRSGGFKTEVTSSSKDIGEVDAIEALKSEKLSGSKHSQEPSTNEHVEPASGGETPGSANHTTEKTIDYTEKADSTSTSSVPQPSEATLAAIQSVEAKIAERRQEESEKKNSTRNADRKGDTSRKGDTYSKANSGNRSHKTAVKSNSAPTPEGGLLTKITQFFSNLFGDTSSQSTSGSKSGRAHNNNRRRSVASKNNSGTRQRNNSRSRQKNNSQQRRNEGRSQRNGQRSVEK